MRHARASQVLTDTFALGGVWAHSLPAHTETNAASSWPTPFAAHTRMLPVDPSRSQTADTQQVRTRLQPLHGCASSAGSTPPLVLVQRQKQQPGSGMYANVILDCSRCCTSASCGVCTRSPVVSGVAPRNRVRLVRTVRELNTLCHLTYDPSHLGWMLSQTARHGSTQHVCRNITHLGHKSKVQETMHRRT